MRVVQHSAGTPSTRGASPAFIRFSFDESGSPKDGSTNVRLVSFNTVCVGLYCIYSQSVFGRVFVEHLLTSVVQFQQDSMAAQIRYYRARHQQQRAYIEKLKREMAELKRANQYLSGEISPYQQGVDSSQQQIYRRRDEQEPSENLNTHGKRPMNQRYGLPCACF